MNMFNKKLRQYMNTLISLRSIPYESIFITYRSIYYLDKSSKEENDTYNKSREYIIGAIINNVIDEHYYIYSRRWKKLRQQIQSYINILCDKHHIINYKKIECIHKAGRGNHYDFKLCIDDREFHIEFKYNSSIVNDAPQFVSPMKPSQYLNMEFEPWFYDNYLIQIANYGNLIMPDRDKYLKTIHSNKVECMNKFKDKYDTNSLFKKYCQDIDKQSIRDFIQMTHIDMNNLSDYLLEGQKNKVYMCYKENKFHYDTIDESMYKIKCLDKKENTNYIYITYNGSKLEIKLRFKNGCGLQFPAFQIKRKIPTIEELKQLCEVHRIPAPRLKKDICLVLDKHKVVY